MIRKSSTDTCVNCGLPAHSPIAQTSGALVCQPLIHPYVAAVIQLDAGPLEPDLGGVGRAPHRDQNVGAVDLLLSGGRVHDEADASLRIAPAHGRVSAATSTSIPSPTRMRWISSDTSRSSRAMS